MVSAAQDGHLGNFERLQDFQVEYAPLRISRYRSKKTGLNVCLAQHESPITNGHFIVPTEIFDDTGRPHTLEHLVFMGSANYKYKGVLDSLANRAGSNGTNAWTADDHTAYTISTAGSQGFLNMLPIYVDHILHATMTDASFVTEIHHINENGENAGVVYSEMQGRINQCSDRMELEMKRVIYPEDSAYRSDTGGLLESLRTLTADQIRQYHAKYYVPHNLCLHMDGALDEAEVFKVLNDKVEPMIVERLRQGEEWKRPFVGTTTAKPVKITKSAQYIVEFMEEDESVGTVSVNFLGPDPNDSLQNNALDILNAYLKHSATSPLRKEFVEIPEPLATSISSYVGDHVNSNVCQWFLEDVPKDHLEHIGERFKAKLRHIANSEVIDMERMAMTMRRKRRQMLNGMEADPSSGIANAVIADLLYGDADGLTLPEWFSELRDYEELFTWTESQWRDLLKKYYVDGHSITMVGMPSAKLATDMEKTEADRLAKQRTDLGEEGLKKCAQAVKEAKEATDVPIPPEMLSDFPLTEPKSLRWVPVETAVNNAPGSKVESDAGEVQKHVSAHSSDLPYQAHFSHVKSNFVAFNVLFDTVDLPSELKPYLSIIQSALFTLGVKGADGKVLSHEEAVDQLNEFSVSNGADFAFRRTFEDVFTIGMKVEKENFERAVAWIRDLLTGAVFDKERLLVIMAKELQSLPEQKRDGDTIARAWANRLIFDAEKATSEACGLLKSLEFTPEIVEQLKTEPEAVISKLEETRRHLLDTSKMRVSVSGNILDLPEPRVALARSFMKLAQPVPLSPLSTSHETLTPLGKDPKEKCILVSMASIEGSYSVHYAKGPVGWDHPELPALSLASTALNAMESYLWKSIRGSGLAYGAHVEVDQESGHVGFSVYRSPDAAKAYSEAGKLMRQLGSGEIELEDHIIDGAKASMLFSVANSSSTPGSAASEAYLNEALKGLGKNFSKERLEKISLVTKEDVQRVITKYFVPLFSPETSVASVTANAGKADEMETKFVQMGFTVERKELPHLSFEHEESGEEYSEEESEDER